MSVESEHLFADCTNPATDLKGPEHCRVRESIKQIEHLLKHGQHILYDEVNYNATHKKGVLGGENGNTVFALERNRNLRMPLMNPVVIATPSCPRKGTKNGVQRHSESAAPPTSGSHTGHVRQKDGTSASRQSFKFTFANPGGITNFSLWKKKEEELLSPDTKNISISQVQERISRELEDYRRYGPAAHVSPSRVGRITLPTKVDLLRRPENTPCAEGREKPTLHTAAETLPFTSDSNKKISPAAPVPQKSDLILQNSSDNFIDPVNPLPAWLRLYNRAAASQEKRKQEAMQQQMEQFTSSHKMALNKYNLLMKYFSLKPTTVLPPTSAASCRAQKVGNNLAHPKEAQRQPSSPPQRLSVLLTGHAKRGNTVESTCVPSFVVARRYTKRSGGAQRKAEPRERERDGKKCLTAVFQATYTDPPQRVEDLRRPVVGERELGVERGAAATAHGHEEAQWPAESSALHHQGAASTARGPISASHSTMSSSLVWEIISQSENPESVCKECFENKDSDGAEPSLVPPSVRPLDLGTLRK